MQVVPPVKKSRQRKKQKRAEPSDTDGSDYEETSKRLKPETSTQSEELISTSPQEQSVWGQNIPEKFLYRVFEYLCKDQGSLPLLVK